MIVAPSPPPLLYFPKKKNPRGSDDQIKYSAIDTKLER